MSCIQIKAGIQSVEHVITAVESRYFAKVADVFSKTQKGLGYFIDDLKVKTLVKEIFGDKSGDAEVATLAQSVKDTLEELRLHFNRYGGNIKKLSNWGLPQSHSHYKVISKGRQAWIDFTLPLLDRGRYRKEDGSLMSETEVKKVLSSVYDTISSEGHNKPEVQYRAVEGITDLPVGVNMQALHQYSREVHFKDGESWLKYQEDFGELNFHDLLSNHIRRLSTEIGLMQTFGSNPEKLVKQLGHDLFNQAMQDAKYSGQHTKLKKQYQYVGRYYDELARQAVPVDSALAQVGSIARSWTVASKMGSATITALGDFATMKLASEMHGLAFTDILGKEVNLLTDKAHRDFAISIGLGAREMTSALVRFRG